MESKNKDSLVVDILIKVLENTFSNKPNTNMIKELHDVEDIPFLHIINPKDVQDSEKFTMVLKKELKYALTKFQTEFMLKTERNLLLYFVLFILKEAIFAPDNKLPSLTIKGILTLLLTFIIDYSEFDSTFFYKCSFTICDFYNLKMENLPNIFKDSMRKAELQAHNYMITDILSLLVEINDIVNQKNKIECNEQNQELTIVSNYIKQMQLLKDHVDKYDRKTFRTLSNYIFKISL